MKHLILIILSVIYTGCATIENPNGRFTSTPFSWKASSVEAFKQCMKDMTAPAKKGDPRMPRAEADRYCRNAATFGAPPSQGSPDQNPPQICGQNVRCPKGVPNGFPKFDGIPPLGVQYQIIDGAYYGVQPLGVGPLSGPLLIQPGPHLPATSGYHAELGIPGMVVGYAGDPATAGTPQNLATTDQVDELRGDLKVVVQQTGLHRKELLRRRAAEQAEAAEGDSK